MIQARCLLPFRVQVDEPFPVFSPCFSDCRERHSCPLLPPWDPPRPTGRSEPDSYEVTAFSLCPGVHETLVCLPRKESLFHWFCGSPGIKPCWPSKPNALGLPPPDGRPQGWGAWHGAQTSPVGELWNIIILQFVSHCPRDMGFNYNVSVPLLLSYCGFSSLSLGVVYICW